MHGQDDVATQEHACFEWAWPELDRRLRCLLARKAVPFSLRDDIVQETGLRLFSMWDHVDPIRGPWSLAATIANNLVYDETRRPAKEVVGQVPERAAPDHVENTVVARLELSRVRRALARMSTNYRAIILAEIGYDLPLTDNPRAINMLRMRARRRLSALVDKIAALGLVVPTAVRSASQGWRRRTAWPQCHLSPDAQPLVPAAAASLAAITVAVIGITPGVPADVPQKPITRTATHTLANSSEFDLLSGGQTVHHDLEREKNQARVDNIHEPKQDPPDQTAQEETTVDAGPARARAGEGESTYVAVCTGEDSSNEEDDSETSVTIGDGGQDGSGDSGACSHQDP